MLKKFTEKMIILLTKTRNWWYKSYVNRFGDIEEKEGKAMYTIFDIANWFLQKESMNHRKLQKLCYYAQAWHLAMYNKTPLFNGTFEAWVHGPVNRKLWNDLKEYGYVDVPQDHFSDIDSSELLKDSDTDQFLEGVWNTYGGFNGYQLERLTHNEAPWLIARGDAPEQAPSNKIISNIDMYNYYNQAQLRGDGIGE